MTEHETILVRKANGDRARKEIPDPTKAIESILLLQLARLELIAAERPLDKDEIALLKVLLDKQDILPVQKTSSKPSKSKLSILKHINAK